MRQNHIIRKRDSHVFNHEIILNSNISDNNQNLPESYPIYFHKEQFKDVDFIEVRHTIEVERFWWLPFPLIKGILLLKQSQVEMV
jgi:hypothetical protein